MLLSAFNQAPPCCCCSRCLKLKKLIKRCDAQEVGEETDKTFSQRDNKSGRFGRLSPSREYFVVIHVSAQFPAQKIHPSPAELI